MSNPTQLTCDACGTQFDLTPEYLAQYAGQTTACACGRALTIPAAPPAVQLAYAAPALGEKLPRDVFRDGDFLVARIGVKLPRRCAACGQSLNFDLRPTRITVERPTEERIRLGGLSGMLKRALEGERMVIRIGRCPDHAPRVSHHTAKLLMRIGIAACAPTLFATAYFAGENDKTLAFVMLATMGVIVLACSVLALFTSPIEGVSVERGFAWLKGFGQGYLALFPTLQEARDKNAAHTAQALDQVTD